MQEEEKELSKEEILKRSRKENESGDERQRDRMKKWPNYFGFVATLFACCIVLIVKVSLEENLPVELFAIMFTGIAAQNIAQAIALTKKKLLPLYLVTAVLISGVAILYWVQWIMGFFGV